MTLEDPPNKKFLPYPVPREALNAIVNAAVLVNKKVTALRRWASVIANGLVGLSFSRPRRVAVNVLPLTAISVGLASA